MTEEKFRFAVISLLVLMALMICIGSMLDGIWMSCVNKDLEEIKKKIGI